MSYDHSMINCGVNLKCENCKVLEAKIESLEGEEAACRCQNCKVLEEKLDNLQVSINFMMQKIDQMEENGVHQNRSIMAALAELNDAPVKKGQKREISDFPICSDSMLIRLEASITKENHKHYVNTISKLLGKNLSKNLNLVLNEAIIMQYNIEGTHGKKKLRHYEKFYSALLDAILAMTGGGHPEQMLRKAIQNNKKKQFRNKADPLKCERHDTSYD